MKVTSGAAILLSLLLLSGVAAFAQDPVFPTVTYEGFNPGTYLYTYRIDCPIDSTYPFGQLVVQAEVPNFGIYAPWGLSADTAPSTLWDMYTQVRLWVPERVDNAIWRAPTVNEVVPAATVWSGRFYLSVPNSTPTGGLVVTLDGGPATTNGTSTTVPGPAPIPEPSSLLALGALAGGFLPLIRWRR